MQGTASVHIHLSAFASACTSGNLSIGPSKSSGFSYCPDLSDLTPSGQHGPKEEGDIEVQEDSNRKRPSLPLPNICLSGISQNMIIRLPLS